LQCGHRGEGQAFLQAVDNTAGCLVDAQCVIQRYINKVYFDVNATITEGAFETTAINGLCKAEQKGVILPVAGCYDVLDACDAINGDDGDGGLLGAPVGGKGWYTAAIVASIKRLNSANPGVGYFSIKVIRDDLKVNLPDGFKYDQNVFSAGVKHGIDGGTLFAMYNQVGQISLTCN
jgi:hypothetical protein